MSNISPKLSQTIDSLVEALYVQAQELVLEMMKDAFASQLGAMRGQRTPKKALPVAAAPKTTSAALPKVNGKRSRADLGVLKDQIFDHIRKNPGQRMEQISAAFETDTKDLRLPIGKLLDDKKIRVKGQRRGTRYFPAGR